MIHLRDAREKNALNYLVHERFIMIQSKNPFFKQSRNISALRSTLNILSKNASGTPCNLVLLASALFCCATMATSNSFSVRPATNSCDSPLLSRLIKADTKSGHAFKTINDASRLNETRVFDIIPIKTTEDISQAVEFAKANNLQIAVSGSLHSMGGHAFCKGCLLLDMRTYNKILSLNELSKTLTVQSGATWDAIQRYLNAKKLAVKSMQSSSIFTVGGSMSVNAHGMDHTVGSIASTIKSFSLLLADGSRRQLTRETDPELFSAVIGGYGLFGIILEVELELTDNVLYEFEMENIGATDWPRYYQQQKHRYTLLYAHLSTSPATFFREMITYGYKKSAFQPKRLPPLKEVSAVGVRKFLLNLSKISRFGQLTKWFTEKHVDPFLHFSFKEPVLISRNQAMYDRVEYLENVRADETAILQEYFIPMHLFSPFISKAADLLKSTHATVLNASVRTVKRADILLNYAPADSFAIVLYLNMKTSPQDIQTMQALTRDLIDLSLRFKGTFFLPYQLCYTKSQLKKAYPMIESFCSLKKKYDPTILFMNEFYKYIQ